LLVHRYGLVTEHSRKARAARNLYENLRGRIKPHEWLPAFEWDSIHAEDGIKVPVQDMHRILNIRFQDEHLSPYLKTDMNLFQMLMLDETVQVFVYKADHGWLFVFDGLLDAPKPFGQSGFDMR